MVSGLTRELVFQTAMYVRGQTLSINSCSSSLIHKQYSPFDWTVQDCVCNQLTGTLPRLTSGFILFYEVPYSNADLDTTYYVYHLLGLRTTALP